MNISVVLSIILSFAITLTSCEKNDSTDNPDMQNIPSSDIQENAENAEEISSPDIVEPITPVVPPEPVVVNKFASETLEEFFAKSAFVGDSVMHGFELYCGRNNNIENGATFLTKTSFAARHALSDVTEGSYHPSYNGTKMKVEDALVLDGANKVFLFLGLNDVRVTPKTYYDNYITLIDRIREKCPDIDIFIVSTTYPIQYPNPNKMGSDVALDYRNQLLDLNTRLKQYADEGNAYYIDVITPISSETGFLDNSYSSDSYVHLTNKAYTIWSGIFQEYAKALIETGNPPVSNDEQLSAEPEVVSGLQETSSETVSSDSSAQS